MQRKTKEQALKYHNSTKTAISMGGLNTEEEERTSNHQKKETWLNENKGLLANSQSASPMYLSKYSILLDFGRRRKWKQRKLSLISYLSFFGRIARTKGRRASFDLTQRRSRAHTSYHLIQYSQIYLNQKEI